MNRFSIEFLSSHDTLWIALAPLLVALAIWVYYRTVAPLERPTKTVLRILRGLAFLIILFALAEPVLTLILPEPGKPGIAVLVDDSSSMTLPGSDPAVGSRADEASALAQRIEDELSGQFRLDWFRFDAGIAPSEDRPLPGADGNTAMGDALDAIALRQGSRPVGGVMVLTDGVNTVGSDPVGSARSVGVPVYPVRVGQETMPTDAKILAVRANPIAFSGEPTPLEIEIASTGLAGSTISVEVSDQGTVLGTRQITLGGGEDVEQSVRIDLRPSVPGRRRLETRLLGLTDAVKENDVTSVAIQVMERKTKILVLEGRLDWDHAFLRRTLGADSTFAYRFLLCDRNGRWLPERSGATAPEGPSNLRDYAVIVLGDVPASALGSGFYGRLARYLEEGGGLLAIGGRSGLGRLRSTAVGPILPVDVSGGAWEGRPIPVRLEAAGLIHPVTTLEDLMKRPERVWSSLPPVWPSPDRLRPKPGASVLLSFDTGSDTEPALVVGFAGEGKVALLAAHDFWRWGFLTRGAGANAVDVFSSTALRMIRWLAEPTMRDRFVAEPVRGVFQNGESPEFSARLWDDRYSPVSDAKVTVEIAALDSITSFSGSRALELRPRGLDGNYGASTDPLPPGSYRFVAEARSTDGETLLGRLESSFWVDENGPEFLRVRPDPGTLEQIARASGGVATDAEGLESVLSRLPDAVRRIGRVREIDLWNQIGLFIAFIVVLSIEWFLRRRRGLA